MKRGQLRIYLGAAPGVGKTYAMLGEGHRRAARGTDVVVGFVETHGRRLTAAAARGPGDGAPPRRSTYRGARSTEMDLDAVLARHPQVALVDELAHTNVPGSRNAKRWQDVEELLDAGIDVITTVNIQHLESLNDVVREDHRRHAAGDACRTRWSARAEQVETGRHDAGGAAAADGARQRLAAGEDRGGADQLLPGRKPDRAARARPAVGGRPGRRGPAAVPGRARHRGRPGKPGSASWSR